MYFPFLEISSPLLFHFLCALFIFILLIFSIVGFTSDKKAFFSFWPLFPYVICLLSFFLPQQAIQFSLFSLLIMGQFRFWRKFFPPCKLRLSFRPDFLRKYSHWEKILWAFIVIYLGSKWMNVFIPGGNNDVLLYHLLAPKDWALYMEGVHFRPDFPSHFMATYFEYFYYAIFLLFKDVLLALQSASHSSYEGLLIVLQILCQMILASASYAFIPYLLFHVTRRPSVIFGLLTVLLVLSIQISTWSWYLAKNDSIPLLCILLSYSYLQDFLQQRKFRSFFLTFLLLGIGIGVKFSNIYPMFFIVLYLLIKYRQQLLQRPGKELGAKVLKAALIFSLGASPVFLRNYHSTKNPFFPVNSSLFRNHYFAPKHMRYLDHFSGHSGRKEAIQKVKNFWKKSYALWATLLLSLLLKIFFEPLFFMLMIFVISFCSGPPIEWRLFSVLLFFLPLWVSLLVKKAHAIGAKERRRIFPLGAWGLTILLTCHFNVEFFWLSGKQLWEKAETVLARHQGNFALIMRINRTMNQNPEFNYISTGIHDLYYLRSSPNSINLALPKWHTWPPELTMDHQR